MKKGISLILIVLTLLFVGCGENKPLENTGATAGEDVVVDGAKMILRIVSGSENKELLPILQAFGEKEKINIDMTYRGSVDIMRDLEAGAKDVDGVWPASSLWISVGDKNHIVKHTASISLTPVVIGVRESLAQTLGFTGKEVSIREVMEAIKADKLKFTMTSATQSNSGASAYLGFLSGLLGNPEVITSDLLDKPELQKDIVELLSGVTRSSGSSEWLKTLFLEGDYDAMVNYESLIITTNQELTRQGKEPLYAIYPYDALTLSDAPLGYVDHGDMKKEEAFLKLQKYLLSEEVQKQIQAQGRRTGYSGVDPENAGVFNPDWGIQVDRVLSPMKLPAQDVLLKALNRYQTEFRKPSFTVYCLDYSGSMAGSGNEELEKAMEQILIQQNATKYLLQAGANEKNTLVLFSDRLLDVQEAEGNGNQLEGLYTVVESASPSGGNDMYSALSEAMKIMASADLSGYSPAIILMSDGESIEVGKGAFVDAYKKSGLDIPIFSIMFGEANDAQLKELAELTNARVFDGREDLIHAFRSVKGYN